MNSTIKLSQLPRGVVARIAAISGADKGLADSLAEIGFRAGDDVEVLERGLFGGTPVAVRIGRAIVALRRFEADAVEVMTP